LRRVKIIDYNAKAGKLSTKSVDNLVESENHHLAKPLHFRRKKIVGTVLEIF